MLSPREIVTQQKVNYDKDYRVDFGAYIYASINAEVTIDQTPCTHSYKAREPSGN